MGYSAISLQSGMRLAGSILELGMALIPFLCTENTAKIQLLRVHRNTMLLPRVALVRR